MWSGFSKRFCVNIKAQLARSWSYNHDHYDHHDGYDHHDQVQIITIKQIMTRVKREMNQAKMRNIDED